MEHTNNIAVRILEDEYSDYPRNAWHYDRQYKMIVKGIEMSKSSISLTIPDEPLDKPLDKEILKALNDFSKILSKENSVSSRF